MKRRIPGPSTHDIESEGLPSASGFDAEFRCPGKRNLCASLPSEEDTAAANRGVRIHKAMESWDLEQLAPNERRTAQRIMFGESEIVHEYNFEGAEVTFEQRIWDFDDSLNHLWSARVDRYDLQMDKRRLLVIDDKSGWTTPPPIKDNWQVRAEGALLSELYQAQETVVALIHPHHPDCLWEAAVIRRAQAIEMLDTIRVNVRAIQQPDAPRIAGTIQCQWCKAKRICPEYQAAAASLAQAIEDEVADEGFTAIIRRSELDRGEHVRWIKELQKNCEFILGQYVELMERDGAAAIAGWRLRRKLTRVITNEIQAIELSTKAWGEDVVNSALHLSAKSLEDELATKMTRKAAKQLVADVLAPVMRFDKSKNYLEEARSL